jgi:hypothetical protein
LLTATAVLGLLAWWATAGSASAHTGNPDFSSVVRGVTPSTPGLEVEMLGGDDRLRIRDSGHHTIVVLGYDGEPYARLLPSGAAQVNVRSPATYLNRERAANVAVPARADPGAAPVWRASTSTGALEWHDHRAHWMGLGTPPQVTDPAVRTKVFDYRVPITVDGRPGAIEGTLFWVGRGGGAPVWAGVGLAAAPVAAFATVLIGAWWLRRRRGRGPRDPAGEAG